MKKPEGLPDPGLYEDVEFPIYLNDWEAASNSGLALIRRSPAHYKHDRESDEDDETPAKGFGRAAHAAVLEPDIYGESYVAADQCSFTKGDGSRCTYDGKHVLKDGRSACGVHVKGVPEDELNTEAVIITPSEVEALEGMSKAVWDHPAAAELLRSDGPTEVSGVWQDPGTQAWCKMRIDKVSWPYSTVIDYKTTRDASRFAFERAIWNFGYHRQGSHYTRGMEELHRQSLIPSPVEHYVIIAQEKYPPYAVAVYRMTEGALDLGGEYLDALLPIYVECWEKDEWPAYSQEVQEIAVPAWAWSKGDDELYELDPTRGP